jgi:hypothetical protein
MLPAQRRRFLAGLGRRLTAQALSRREPERRYPILLTLLAESVVDVLDEVVLLFHQALSGHESAARTRLTEELTERARVGEDRQALLATRLAVLRAHPRRTIRSPLRLRRDRILRRRRGRVRRVPPEAPTQLGVLRLHRVQSRHQPFHQRTKLDHLSGKLLIGRTSTTGHPTMINIPVKRSRRHAVTRQTPAQAHP